MEEVAPSLHLGVVAIEKGAFWSPLTTVTNFTLTLLKGLVSWPRLDDLSLRQSPVGVSVYHFLGQQLDCALLLLLFFFFFFDANKTAGEETRWQLHKNAACNPQQVLAATPTRHQLYGHLPPITKTIQVRRTRHAGHCWRSRDELIRDVLLWIPTHGRAKAGRPARTYIQQLCEDTGCCPEDLPRAMNDREEWRERVRDIRAASTI